MPEFVQSSFTSGELSPRLHNRPTLSRYLAGLKRCENMYVHREGGASNRPGFEFVAEVKDSTKATRVAEFLYSTKDTYCLEVGEYYIRVFREGAVVLVPLTAPAWSCPGLPTVLAYSPGQIVSNGGALYLCTVWHLCQPNYEPGVGANWTDVWVLTTSSAILEIATPYTEAELFELTYVQSGDVITICHPTHPPSQLVRYAVDDWRLEPIDFSPAIEAPINLAMTGGVAPVRTYVVTAISEETSEESVASASTTGNEDGGTLTWDAVTGASEYAVYREDNGIFGFIGMAGTNSFTDAKILPELDDTPPTERNPFDGVDKYPSVSAYHEQRQVYANSNTYPQKVWFSQTGNFTNFNTSSPLKADDAITLSIDSGQVNEVRNLISMNDMLVMTAGAEHKISSGDNAFAFENLRSKPESYVGSVPYLRPIVIGNTVLYVQAHGTEVYDLAYALETDGYDGQPISLLSSHLLENNTLVDWSFAKVPESIIWMVRNDGTLLGLTYLKKQEVIAWHRHTTDGLIESVCSLPEGTEDYTYVVVKRTINGVDKRYIERMHSRKFTSVEQCFFVDSGLSYSGAATDTLTGLGHLEGEEVAILADGHVFPRQTVTGGQVVLTQEVTVAHIGLPYEAHLGTLEPPIEEVQGRRKKASQLRVGVLNSRGMHIGFDETEQSEWKQREFEDWGDPTELFTGYVDMVIEPSFETRGELLITQKDPLPLTVLSITPDYDVEG